MRAVRGGGAVAAMAVVVALALGGCGAEAGSDAAEDVDAPGVDGVDGDASADAALDASADAALDAGAEVTVTSAILVGGAGDDGQGFVALGSGSSAPVLPGWQGLQHLWVSVRLPAGLAPPGKVVVAVRLFDAVSGAAVAPGPTIAKVALTPVADDPTLVGYDGIAAVVLCPCKVKGRRVRVRVAIDGVAGAPGEAETTATWKGPCPGKEPPSCQPAK